MAGIDPKALSLASTVLTGSGQLYGALQERKAAKREAAGYAREASEARATAQAEASEERRKSRYLRSRARAVAAASGAGVTDPTMIRIMADLESTGVYNALSRLYTGETEARGLEDMARARKREGRARMFGGFLNTASTVLSGIETWRRYA